MKFIFSTICAFCGAINQFDFNKLKVKELHLHESELNDELKYHCRACKQCNELLISIESVKGGGDD